MYLKILLIGFLFTNYTSQVNEPVYTYEVNHALRPYVIEYLDTIKEYGIKFKKQSFIVVFDGDMIKTPIAGQAKGMFNNNLVYVKINPQIWGGLTIKQKRHLIFHELSHDVFNIKHTEDIELMRPSMASPSESFQMNIEKEITTLMKYIKNEQS